MTDDASLVRETLLDAGLDAPRDLAAWVDRPSTTARLQIGSTDGVPFVAKVSDAPETLERARREAAVLAALADPLGDLGPRLLAARLRPDHVVVVVERVFGRAGDAVAGAGVEDVAAVAARMEAAWTIDVEDPRIAALELPGWGRGTGGTDPHRRRRDRLARRLDSVLARFPTATDVEQSFRRLLARFETLADRPGRGLARLVHGDLHPDNLVFTEDGPRVLDWQKASLGDPLDDLARLHLESTPRPDLGRLVELAASLPGPTPEFAEVATASLLVWSGFLAGMAGRPILDPGSRDHALVARVLGPDGPHRLVFEALDALGA